MELLNLMLLIIGVDLRFLLDLLLSRRLGLRFAHIGEVVSCVGLLGARDDALREPASVFSCLVSIVIQRGLGFKVTVLISAYWAE